MQPAPVSGPGLARRAQVRRQQERAEVRAGLDAQRFCNVFNNTLQMLLKTLAKIRKLADISHVVLTPATFEFGLSSGAEMCKPCIS